VESVCLVVGVAPGAPRSDAWRDAALATRTTVGTLAGAAEPAPVASNRVRFVVWVALRARDAVTWAHGPRLLDSSDVADIAAHVRTQLGNIAGTPTAEAFPWTFSPSAAYAEHVLDLGMAAPNGAPIEATPDLISRDAKQACLPQMGLDVHHSPQTPPTLQAPAGGLSIELDPEESPAADPPPASVTPGFANLLRDLYPKYRIDPARVARMSAEQVDSEEWAHTAAWRRMLIALDWRTRVAPGTPRANLLPMLRELLREIERTILDDRAPEEHVDTIEYYLTIAHEDACVNQSDRRAAVVRTRHVPGSREPIRSAALA
jgi:hypothetical protein